MNSIATPGCGCGGGETQPPDEFNPTLIQQGGAVGSIGVASAASTIVPHVTYGYEHGATSPQQEAMLRVVKGATAQSTANNMLGGADTGMGGIVVPQVHTQVTSGGPNNSNTISAATNAAGVQAAANRALDACIGQGPECTGQVMGTSQDGGRKRGKGRLATHRRRRSHHHRRHRHTVRKHSGGKRRHHHDKKMSHKVRHTRSKYTRSRKH